MPVYVRGDGRDAMVRLTLLNRTEHRIRVGAARVDFLAGERTVGSRSLGRGFFKDDRFPRPTRLDRGRQVEWRAICLDSPPPEAERVRFELELTGRFRGSPVRQTVEVALVPAPEPRRLHLPFDGYWRVSQGHECPTSHRVGGFGGDFAWDFAALGAQGRTASEAYDATRRNEDAYSFGRTVLAPVDGRVVRAVDGIPDNEGLKRYPRRSLVDDLRNPDWVFGNVIVLDAGAGAFVLLAHLREGSIRVAPGQPVRRGEPLAQCGNSGNTIEPHLHLQVMDRADPAHPRVRGLPAVFVDYREFAPDRESGPQKLLARRMEVGDPPEGSIVAPARETAAGGPGSEDRNPGPSPL